MTACTADIVAAHEVLPNSDNRLTLSDKKDWLGLPKPSIHYDVGDYVRKSWETYSLPIGKQIAEAMGATDVKISPKFNNSKHIMGGTIMGKDAGNSVVTSIAAPTTTRTCSFRAAAPWPRRPAATAPSP